MYALDGPPRITHIWGFESLEQRAALRAKFYAAGLWPLREAQNRSRKQLRLLPCRRTRLRFVDTPNWGCQPRSATMKENSARWLPRSN
jgi:hypothetical protein